MAGLGERDLVAGGGGLGAGDYMGVEVGLG